MELIKTIPILFFWWYTGGIKKLLNFSKASFIFLKNIFDPLLLLKTLLSPWKKLVSSPAPGLFGLKDWLVENLISRGVGFVIRIFVLGGFLIFLAVYLAFFTFVVAFWFLFPLILVYFFLSILAHIR